MDSRCYKCDKLAVMNHQGVKCTGCNEFCTNCDCARRKWGVQIVKPALDFLLLILR